MRALLFCLALLIGPGAAIARDFVFAGYNIENYAPVPVPTPPGAAKARPVKSAESARAVVQVISELSPDILGLCEMGSEVQFNEFRARMAEAGMGYMDGEWVDGPDPDRHLALLSRFPIVASHSEANLPIPAGPLRQKVRRGYLDVTVEVSPGYCIRIVGVHLKSKRPSPEGSVDLERRQEAHQVRLHIEQILAADPETPLLVFGDFNDTKEQATLQEIKGARGTANALMELRLADPEGDRWTYYWKAADIYSRIDFLLVSRALAPRVNHEASGVYRTPDWNVASDHRPIFATFKPPFME